MNRKYYAYLGKDGYWAVKRFHGVEWLLGLIKQAFESDFLVQGYLLPWEVNVTAKEWKVFPESDINHPAWRTFFTIMPHAKVVYHGENRRL